MEKQALLFYIGNAAVKMALVSFSSTSSPKILFLENISVPVLELGDKNQIQEKIVSRFEDLCRAGKKALLNTAIKNKKIDKIVSIISAPWYISFTKLAKSQKDEPFIVKENLLSDLMVQMESEIEKEHGENLEPLEKKIINITLNGYRAVFPINKKAQSIEVAMVESFAEKNFLEKVRNTINNYFISSSLHEHTLSLASFTALRDILKDLNDFLFVNVTSLVTEISLVKNNILHETISVPMGFKSILETISQDLKIDEVGATTILKMYMEQKTETQISEKIKTIIDEYLKKWGNLMVEAIRTLSGGISLPANGYLLCHQVSMEDFFDQIIKNIDYSQLSIAAGEFKMNVFRTSNFISIIDFNRLPLDSSIAVATLYAKKIFSDQVKKT